MKLRMLAVLSILSLPAWLPLRAQQVSRAPQTSQAQAPAEDSSKPATRHDGCCAAKAQRGEEAAAAPDHHQMGCCNGREEASAKGSCCEGQDPKETSCCAKDEKTNQAGMQCGAGMKGGQRAANDAKSCCKNRTAKDGRRCCSRVAGHCAAHAETKS